MKLLIIDDEARTRELLRKHIPWEEIGITEVRTAHNGLVSLDITSDWRPDVILCDVRMPKLNGIGFATQYRKIDPKCPVIFLSGYSDKEF
ncbi:response regulator [Cohnella sp. GCM10012308]|uniref:response regulator n=1 Tax=Cohnella sp. GCM10012308 TaxID=3317329 RepID=UPI003611D283